jgi:hypothetical protein
MTAKTPPMPLFYNQITPLDAKKHAGMGLKPNINLSFAAGTHAVPVNAIECVQLCAHYPIVFSPEASATPVAVLGLKEGQNLFVTKEGGWIEPEAYIPAYIRRYPFLLASVTGTDQLTLCFDDVPAVVAKSSAMPFFVNGETPSDMTKNALEYCKSFHAATLQTQGLCQALTEAGVLVDRAAEIPLPAGQPAIKFGGFRIIDDQKFAALPDATILEWRRKGYLPTIFAVLISSGRWAHLARLYMDRQKSRAA